MNKIYPIICCLAFFLFSSFKINKACQYAGSNLGYIQSQTEKAISEKDIKMAHYYTYKALNAIDKSNKDFMDCGCEDAYETIEQGQAYLKKAVQEKTLDGTKNYLKNALAKMLESITALEIYEDQMNHYPTDVLALNTTGTSSSSFVETITTEKQLHDKIDRSLLKYKESLNYIVESVNCQEALTFATRIYNECEAELLKPNLSEGKKYYNLKTKEITAEALGKLESYCTK
ncbi:MAG: hypothetical protein WBM83_09350 [Flavobacteriaceae bacterium]